MGPALSIVSYGVQNTVHSCSMSTYGWSECLNVFILRHVLKGIVWQIVAEQPGKDYLYLVAQQLFAQSFLQYVWRMDAAQKKLFLCLFARADIFNKGIE